MVVEVAVLPPAVEAAAVKTTPAQFTFFWKKALPIGRAFFLPGGRNFRRGRKAPYEFRSSSPKSGQGVETALIETTPNLMKSTLLLLGIAFVSLTLSACKLRGYSGKTPVAQPVYCPPAQASYGCGYTK